MARSIPILTLLLCLLGVVPAGAAPTALRGVVRDSTGGVLPGATVTLTPAGGQPQTAVTGRDGDYEFPTIEPGVYVVEASLSGFETARVEINVTGGNAAPVDFTLTLSGLFERITVTATKTGETDVQTTPIAITALPAKTLEQVGAQSIENLAGLVPTLTISQNTGFAQVTIRGIGTNAIFAGSDPSSTVHLDGVYLGRPASVFSDFLDVERIEVLRGPQGTLYGRNSVGGTINVVTRKPTNDLRVSARLTAGNYAQVRTEGAVSGPIVKDKVMANVAFIRGTRDGFVKDLNHPDHPLGGEGLWAGRAQLRFVFAKRGELLISTDYDKAEAPPLSYSKAIAVKPGFTVQNPSSMWEVRTNYLAEATNVQQGTSARLSIPLTNDVALNSLTAWRKSDYRLTGDTDITELNLLTTTLNDTQHQWSEELTLAQKTARATWVAGLFYFNEFERQRTWIRLFAANLENRARPDVTANAWAGFGQLTYHATSRVSLTGGARYTSERKDLTTSGALYRPFTETVAVPASVFAFQDSVSYDAWTPKAGIDVKASETTMLYASATRGFKSGGYNFSAPEPGRAFAPEYAWSYEGGVKTTLAGGRARLNVAAFYNNYTNLQVQSFIRPGIIDITNAASARIKGLEVEAAAAATRTFQVMASFSVLDAAYDKYIAVGAGNVLRDVSGNKLNNAPAFAGSASVVYDAKAGSAGALSVRADTQWQSRVFFTPFNDNIETQKPYGLLHARVGFTTASGRWEIAWYGRNLTNQPYITGTGSFPPPAIGGRPGDPRNWGTQLIVHY